MSPNPGADERSRRSPRNLLSLALFGVAAALFVVVAILYVQDRNQADPTAPPPPSVPGRAELKNVVDALRARDLDVEYGRGGARIDGLTAAGQELTVAGAPLYVFIFEGPAAREAETADLDPANPGLETVAGEPIAADALHIAAGSNVYAVLTGGTDETASSVAAAIEGLP